jgi:hypothetical protein
MNSIKEIILSILDIRPGLLAGFRITAILSLPGACLRADHPCFGGYLFPPPICF